MCNHQPNLTNLQVLPTNAATPTEAIDHGDHKIKPYYVRSHPEPWHHVPFSQLRPIPLGRPQQELQTLQHWRAPQSWTQKTCATQQHFRGYNGYKVLLTAGSATKQNIAKLEIIICQLQNVKTPQTLLAETI
jgi:hypothetical protein